MPRSRLQLLSPKPRSFQKHSFLLASLNSSLLGFVLIGTCELRLMYGAIQSDSLQPQKWIPASLRVQGLTLDSEGYRQKLSFLSHLPVLSLSVFIQISDQANCACRNLHLYKPCIFFFNIPRLNILTKDENPLTNLPLEKSNIFFIPFTVKRHKESIAERSPIG